MSRHIMLDPDKVIVKMDRGEHLSTLEVDIEVPNHPKTPLPDDCLKQQRRRPPQGSAQKES